jgi:two-component SAPR family response regulator
MLQFFAGRKQSPATNYGEEKKKLKVLCVDDQNIIRDRTIEYIKEIMTDADVLGFENVDEAMSYAQNSGCDILFTEIELYGKPSGIELARNMQKLNSRLNIIFTTVCSPNEYAKEVMELRPSSYLTKVVEIEDIRKAVDSLLYSV